MAAPVPADIFDGIVDVLSSWGWPAGRPSWVTWVPSRRRGALLPDLAQRIAERGRMDIASPLSAHNFLASATSRANGSPLAARADAR